MLNDPRRPPSAREFHAAIFGPPKPPTWVERIGRGIGIVLVLTFAVCVVVAAVCGCVWLVRITF